MSSKTAKKINLKPLGNRVIAKRCEEKEATKGGILLPDSAKQKQETAEIIAVSETMKTKDGKAFESPVKVGNIVLMDKYAGQEVSVDDEEYIIAKVDDIVAIVEE